MARHDRSGFGTQGSFTPLLLRSGASTDASKRCSPNCRGRPHRTRLRQGGQTAGIASEVRTGEPEAKIGKGEEDCSGEEKEWYVEEHSVLHRRCAEFVWHAAVLDEFHAGLEGVGVNGSADDGFVLFGWGLDVHGDVV